MYGREKEIMNRSKTWLVNIIFLAFDILILLAIFRIALLIRHLWMGPGANWETITPVVQLGFIFCIGIFFLQGLYPGYGLTAVKELERMIKAISFAFFLLASTAYLHKPFQIFSRSIVLISWMLSLIALPVSRFLLRNRLSRTSWYGQPVIVFGEDPWASQVTTTLKRVRRLGWVPVTVLPLTQIEQEHSYPQHIRMAILAPSSRKSIGNLARLLNQRFNRVLLLRQGDYFGSQWVEARDLDGFLGLEFHYHLLSRRNYWLKQSIDWLVGGILLTLLSPIFLLLALLVVLDSPGPVFFKQERLGKNLRPFQVIKFRTMLVDAEARLLQVLRNNPIARAEYETHHKLSNDPRVTRLGRWLRKFSLDELPQIVNVLRGEMSLVGPRAYMPSELDEIGNYDTVILRVKSGITGWWQVSGRHSTSFQRRLEMDEYYISNWSVWMDLYILMKTIQVVLSGTGV